MPCYIFVINEAIHILSNDTFAAKLFDISLHQKEKYMFTYKIHFENKYKIVYEYHPEDRDEYGLISIDKNSKEKKEPMTIGCNTLKEIKECLRKDKLYYTQYVVIKSLTNEIVMSTI